jgi:hypothetical protein
MTGKSDFSPEEWKTVLEGPPSAGMLVMTAQRGGTFRESFSMAKSYAEARKEHGESELLDEIAATKPEFDRTRHQSLEELRESCLQHIRDAVELLSTKATPEELDEYGRFVRNLAQRVAEAHREGGEQVSPAESEALAEVDAALGGSTA